MFDWLRDLLRDSLEWFKPFIVLDAYHSGVVLTFGRPRSGWYNLWREPVRGPGFHLIWPFGIEEVQYDVVVARVINLSSQSLTTADGISVVVGGAVTFSISNVQKALLNVKTVHQAIADSCCGLITQVVRKTKWADLTSDDFVDTLTKQCRQYARKYGLDIERVQLTDLSRSRALRLHIDQQNTYRHSGEDASE